MRMGIQFLQGFKIKRCGKISKNFLDCENNLNLQYTRKSLIIRLPDSRVLRLLARSMLLVLFIVSLPWIRNNILGFLKFDTTSNLDNENGGSKSINVELLSMLFHDLTNEGILKIGEKAMILSNGDHENLHTLHNSQILGDNKINVVSVKDLDNQENAMTNESFDFVFTNSFHATAEFIDKTLKIGGVAAIQLSYDPSLTFRKPSNYKIVYIRQLESTVLAIRKIDNNYGDDEDDEDELEDIDETRFSIAKRKLLSYPLEAKKAALKNLEDVLLEPPRAASRKSTKYLKKTRYLPDLMGDSLEGYPRRVFIDVGLADKKGKKRNTNWFSKHYPTRNLDFEIYKIETVTEESSGKEVPQVAEIGMSKWLTKNVKEEEYVVMKTEAEVVEEMVKSKAIRLVDELFLECKPKKGRNGGSKRPYWECLALYGRLRDEGVAVHQWWG